MLSQARTCGLPPITAGPDSVVGHGQVSGRLMYLGRPGYPYIYYTTADGYLMKADSILGVNINTVYVGADYQNQP